MENTYIVNQKTKTRGEPSELDLSDFPGFDFAEIMKLALRGMKSRFSFFPVSFALDVILTADLMHKGETGYPLLACRWNREIKKYGSSDLKKEQASSENWNLGYGSQGRRKFDDVSEHTRSMIESIIHNKDETKRVVLNTLFETEGIELSAENKREFINNEIEYLVVVPLEGIKMDSPDITSYKKNVFRDAFILMQPLLGKKLSLKSDDFSNSSVLEIISLWGKRFDKTVPDKDIVGNLSNEACARITSALYLKGEELKQSPTEESFEEKLASIFNIADNVEKRER